MLHTLITAGRQRWRVFEEQIPNAYFADFSGGTKAAQIEGFHISSNANVLCWLVFIVSNQLQLRNNNREIITLKITLHKHKTVATIKLYKWNVEV